jgi:nickel/cobalt transporter (NicO) family protein
VSHVLLALLFGLAQGLVHAFGPDHCAAMATLGTLGGGRRRGVLVTALRFALGHAVMLGSVATLCLLAGVGLSEAFTRWAEVFGGGVLVALAVAALFLPASAAHGHPHLPGHDKEPHAHRHVSTAAGALMAVSGVRGLLLALPPLLVGGSMSGAAWSYLPGFALGILVGMGAVGLVFAEGLSRLSARVTPWVHRGVALASAALGVFWMAAAR